MDQDSHRQSSLPASLVPHLLDSDHLAFPDSRLPPPVMRWREDDRRPSYRRVPEPESFTELLNRGLSSANPSSSSSSNFQYDPLPLLRPPTNPFVSARRDYPPFAELSISSSLPAVNPYPSDNQPPPSPQMGKRRRAASADPEDTTRKSRKTAVACNFCRGRKLRCDGVKPSCSNCTIRKFECEYVPVQRRRGPGKARKGSRPKKPSTSRSDFSSSSSKAITDRPPSASLHYEYDPLSPDVLRPYIGIIPLNSTQPPDPAPLHHTYSTMGDQFSRPRSRETSSEDQSDGEDPYSKMV